MPKSYPDDYVVNMNSAKKMISGTIYGQIPRDPEALKELMRTQFNSLIAPTNHLLMIRGVKYFFFDFN